MRFISKLFAKRRYDYPMGTSDEEIVRTLDLLSRSLRNPKNGGAGIAIYPISLSLKQGYKTALYKEKNGFSLYGFEKWIKENYRLLFGAVERIKRADFVSLPHVDGTPRVLILADFIVRYSGDHLTREKIENVVKIFSASTPLTYPELERLSDAIAYRLLSEIAALSEQSVRLREDRSRANSRKFRAKFKTLDGYLTYYAEAHPEEKAMVLKAEPDVDWSAAALSFENEIAANDYFASVYINALRSLPKLLPDESFVSFSKINEIYSSDVDYRSMSNAARKDYLTVTHERAQKLSTTEGVIARTVLFLAKEWGVHFGTVLYKCEENVKAYLKSGKTQKPPLNERKVQGGYAAAVLGISLVIAAFPAYYLRTTLSFFAVLPLFIASLHPVEYLLKRFLSSTGGTRPVPQMDHDVLPESCKTVVAVSWFLSSEEEIDAAIKRISILAASCKDKNVFYSVVADLPQSDVEKSEKDEKLLSYLSEKELPSRVSILVRHRVKIGRKWGGYERKRGALLDFLRAVERDNYSDFDLFGEKPQGVFALLLDDDSALLPGAIKAAILAMSHPLNAEYDLLTFGGKVNRFSLSTYYSDKFARSCAIEAYPFYSDFYSEKFDAAIYSGKAIVRISSYVKKLENFFPDGKILSHDVIEGAVLRSGTLKRSVYEDAPKTFAADVLRESRWQRGDVQLLPYALFPKIKNKSGEKMKNPIAPIYKLVLFINGFTVLSDACLFFIALAAFVLGARFLLFYSLSVLLSVYLYALIASARTVFGKVRFRYAVASVLYSVLNLADRLFCFPFRALNGLYLFCTTAFKMATNSKTLLSWTPFKATQKAGGFSDGAKIALPSVLMLCAAVLALGNAYFTIYAFFCTVWIFALILCGREKKQSALDEKERGRLFSYAKEIYAYFSDQNGESLIADNIQFYPYEIKADMTSPTNLGFAFLAEVCAVLLGLSEFEKAVERLEILTKQVEKLETWRGHLYNWYDVRTFSVKPPRVVSTADSANFVACLCVVCSFLKEKGENKLSERLEKIVKCADFSALYDPSDKLLAIVKDVPENRLLGRYDLLASESRLAYYFLTQSGVDPECYFSLGRDCSPQNGNTLLSWSGTAFEYMLPRLFVKAPPQSLLAVQERNSFLVQFREKTEGVFGRSECAYADFNEATAYKYKAIGAKNLALSENCANVIAPYASFLYLPCGAEACVENLMKLDEKGARGKYGFYEAIDFDEGGAIVRSFMTHHQGMSLAAITNALTGDALVRLFNERSENASVALLLAEENVSGRQAKTISSCPERTDVEKPLCFDLAEPSPVYAAKDGDYSLVFDALGRSFSAYKGKRIGKFLPYQTEKGGFFFQIKEDEKIFSPTFYPSGEESGRAVFYSGGIKHENSEFFLETRLLSGYNGEIRKLTIKNDGEKERIISVSGFLDLVLNGKDAYESHPAFSDMFVSTKLLSDTLYAIRKNARCETELACSLTVKGLDDPVFNSNRYNVPGRDCVRDYSEGVKRRLAPPFGDVLYPCFAFCGSVTVHPHSERSVYAVLMAGEGEEELKSKAEKISLAFPSGALDLLGRSKEKEKDLSEIASLGKILLFSRPSNDSLRRRLSMKEKLSSFSIAPEEKIVFVRVEKDANAEYVESICRASTLLSSCGVDHRLVLGAERLGGAIERAKKAAAGANAILVLPLDQTDEIEKCAFVKYPITSEEKSFSPKKIEHNRKPLLPAPEKMSFETGEGGFTRNGYLVRPFGEKTLLPYANVVGARKGGFVLTESGGGFSFGENAREDKLSIWSGDAVSDFVPERVFLHAEGKKYAFSDGRCLHSIGSTSFSVAVGGSVAVLTEYLAERGAVKVFEVVLTSTPKSECKLSFEFFPALGWRGTEQIISEREGSAIRLTNAENGKSVWVYAIGEELTVELPKLAGDPFVFTFPKALEKGAFRFAISSFDRVLTAEELPVSRAKTQSEIFKNSISVSTRDLSLDILYNFSLPYQAQSARLNAKAGFYQVSGAYGFRDQLQDVLSLLISSPERAREQILLSASHQFEEGDVQHWWHFPRTGVRTRISDDRLWLAYVSEKYISVTGDRAILDERVSFLSSDPLSAGEQSRYEIPLVAGNGTLREHILRALRVSLSRGEHGLLKIGTGDWNDGLDRVGDRGRGESVWLTEFAYACLKKCAPFFGEEERAELEREADQLFAALKPLYKGGRYPLCFTDGGEWLGYKHTPKCTLALNPQTWAVLSGALPKSDAENALDVAKALVDPQSGVIKLSSPPFDENSNFGYIAAYPKGVRENGGQYTHAAIWYIKALLESGKADEAYRAIASVNPIERARTREGAEIYKGEPYVLAGDVYGVDPYVGRAGWTWYSGSAAWLKYTLTEDFFGVKKRGDKLFFEPCLPTSFGCLTVRIDLPSVKIEASYRRGGKNAILFRGKECKFVPLGECEKEEKIEVLFV